jgi:hypothetical protein
MKASDKVSKSTKPATRLEKHECAGLFPKISSSQVSLPNKPSVDFCWLQCNTIWRCGQIYAERCRKSAPGRRSGELAND